jgi:hypothetical protein
MTDPARLRHLAERLRGDPEFLAAYLLDYAETEELTDVALAEQLACEPAQLPSVLLCRCPSGPPAQFRSDLQRITDRFGIDPTRLAQIIRQEQALTALREGAADAELPAAARDREPDPPAEEHP